MAELTSAPASAPYRPIAVLAICGLGCAALYTGLVLFTTIIALIQGMTFLLPTWIALLAIASPVRAQLRADSTPRGVPRFDLEFSDLATSGPTRAGALIADIGARAALVGDETGRIEAWLWPEHVVQDLDMSFTPSASGERIAASSLARSVTARPEATTVVYVHPAFTMRQHLFVPLDRSAAMILLDVETDAPLDIHIRIGLFESGHHLLDRSFFHVGSPIREP